MSVGAASVSVGPASPAAGADGATAVVGAGSDGVATVVAEALWLGTGGGSFVATSTSANSVATVRNGTA